MKFPKLLEKTKLIKRYKRFLADVIHPEKGEMTVHCPNTGSMKNCWQEGWTAWILDSENDKRKYRYTWVLTENEKGQLIGINTHFANQIVFEAIEAGKIESLANYQEIKQEMKYGEENSRIDIWLKDENDQQVYIEVKSVTLLEDDGIGYFPDAVTTRGQKHLRELMHCVDQGHRAVLVFLVQHTGIVKVRPASHIDKTYAELFEKAVDHGVEVIVCRTYIDQTGIEVISSAKEVECRV
ncbi:MAG: DNA/RNA nuclease SfsA [Gammaproteobacteria bacterium]|nr:DNA/RNA nuclease SfsA [Gammaproteobacteria bacterium]